MTDSEKLNGGIIDEIEEGFLWLGNKITAGNLELLQQLGITHVVCVLEEFYQPCASCQYLQVQIQDNRNADASVHFQPVVEFIQQAAKAGGKVRRMKLFINSGNVGTCSLSRRDQ
jgi:hypothetical protein